MEVLGIDIGGSGIKGAPVDVSTGMLLAERLRLETPQPSTPRAISEVVAHLVAAFAWKGPIGCTFPAVVKDGVTLTAANVDTSWVGANAARLLSQAVGQRVFLFNDADAAGVAEVRFGAAKGAKGVTLMLTFGTGIGSALLVGETLVPNTEFGHIQVRVPEKETLAKEAEHFAAERVREVEDLPWGVWAERVNVFLAALEGLLFPDLIVIGGGVANHTEKFWDKLRATTPLVPAKLRNNAGIVGAALLAAELSSEMAGSTP
jgi:polyphosphate glucokinase